MAGLRVYAFHGGGEIADMSVFDPFHPEVGTKVEIPYFFYVVAHPGGNVLFDTGGHPALIDDPRERLGEAADAFEVTMEKGDDVVSQLGAAGFAPADVEHVVLSHLHYDHAGGIEFFPDSTFYAASSSSPTGHRCTNVRSTCRPISTTRSSGSSSKAISTSSETAASSSSPPRATRPATSRCWFSSTAAGR